MALKETIPVTQPLRIRSDHWSYKHICCTILLLGYLLWYLRPTHNFWTCNPSGHSAYKDHDEVKQYLLASVDKSRLAAALQHVTSHAHLAGSQRSHEISQWIEAHMRDSGLDSVHQEVFEVYLNYPRADGRSVEIVSPKDQIWQAKLEEEQVYPGIEQTPAFHGMAKAGNASGHLIYANYGLQEDFKTLQELEIELNGSIVLLRQGGLDDFSKIKNAAMYGAVGCLLFASPVKDIPKGGKAWPEGRYRPADGVPRGSTAGLAFIMGDVLSPGFPSLPEEPLRNDIQDNPALPTIPSLPMSWRDAKALLDRLKDRGMQTNETWHQDDADAGWWTGDSASPIIRLQNEQNEVERQPIIDIVGKISGWEQPFMSIIIGNHYDSWCFGSADPGSGTAVLFELIKLFGELRKNGWRPRRSIEFLAFDGEEYNLVGSAEHVEANLESIRQNGCAYINVDRATSGPKLEISATPMFKDFVESVLKSVDDPKSNSTMYDMWKAEGNRVDLIGAGSDYIPFQYLAGVSSIDVSSGGGPYPYHSCHENYEWMAQQGDPGFENHKVIAQILALTILELADAPVLPFDPTEYANAMTAFLQQFEQDIKAGPFRGFLDLAELKKAIKSFQKSAARLDSWLNESKVLVIDHPQESQEARAKRLLHNEKVARIDSSLLDLEGLPLRSQYKHILFGMDPQTGLDWYTIPGARDAIAVSNWRQAQKAIDLAAKVIGNASLKLKI